MLNSLSLNSLNLDLMSYTNFDSQLSTFFLRTVILNIDCLGVL